MTKMLFQNIPTGDAIQYLNTITDTLPTSIAEPIQAAGAQLIPANPQSPMVAQPPQPLAVENPSAVRAAEQAVVDTPKAASNTLWVGGAVVLGLAFLMLRKR